MASYQTRPRGQLLSFLRENPEKGYTAEELAQELSSRYGDDAPGKSTVYRLVNKLVQEEEIKRFEAENEKRAQYRLTGAACHNHLHLKCLDCGKLIHMKEQDSTPLLMGILQQNGFSVDEYQTVLLGHCNLCQMQLKGRTQP
ncbi:MAG: transcriptional repressor [Clostridia bacterium]|nr:transcriptional repressor [Clostridia bacterium]